MIASVDRSRHFEVFMNGEEITLLSKRRIEGALIKIHRPEQQGKISISLDNTISTVAPSGIIVDDKGHSYEKAGRVKLLLNNWAYQHLKEKGLIDVKYGGLGSKVTIYNRDKVDGTDAAIAEHLDFYRDNKKRLREEL